MTIAILDYETAEVLIHQVEEDKLKQYGNDVERIITEDMGYSLEAISWMAAERINVELKFINRHLMA